MQLFNFILSIILLSFGLGLLIGAVFLIYPKKNKMINLPLNEWWLPVLGFIPIIVSVIKIKKKKKLTKDSSFEFIIGALVLLLSVNDNYNNAADRKNYSDSLNTFHSTIKSVQDTLRTAKDTLLKVGLEIDAKTGRLLLIDSQLLKIRFTQTVNNYNYPNDSQIKLKQYFSDLGSDNYYKREIAIDYVVKNFPPTLSREQVAQISKYLMVSNLPGALMNLLSDQPYSSYLTSMMKDVILKKAPVAQDVWRYLFTRTNVDFSLIDSTVKLGAANWDFFRRIAETAIKSGNSKICLKILNSKELISFLIANKNQPQTQTSFEVIRDLVNSSSKYKIYKNTYFFEAMGN